MANVNLVKENLERAAAAAAAAKKEAAEKAAILEEMQKYAGTPEVSVFNTAKNIRTTGYPKVVKYPSFGYVALNAEMEAMYISALYSGGYRADGSGCSATTAFNKYLSTVAIATQQVEAGYEGDYSLTVDGVEYSIKGVIAYNEVCEIVADISDTLAEITEENKPIANKLFTALIRLYNAE